MSYDLYLFRPQPGVEPKVVVEELRSADEGLVLRRMLAAKDAATRETARRAAAARAGPSAESEGRRLAEVVCGLTPKLKLAMSTEGARRLQVAHAELGLQLTFEREHVAVSISYSHPAERARDVFAELSRYVVALERAGGFETYDPQLERVVRLPEEIDAVVTVYARAADTAMNPTLPKRKPWWRPW